MKFTVMYRTETGTSGVLNVVAGSATDAQWSTVEYVNGRGDVVDSADVVGTGFAEGAPIVNALS